MNLILTPKCNKNCKNCFAKEYKEKGGPDLDLSFLEKVEPWDQISSPDIGILGGEPTLNPNFFLILKKLQDLNYVPVIFSNFLFDDLLKKKLSFFIIKNPSKELKFLVNINDLNKSQLDRVIENINFIQKTFLSINKSNKLSLSLTLDIDNPELNLIYLYSFYKELNFNYRLRLGVALPSDSEKKPQYKKVINNKELGKIIVKILNWSQKQNIDLFLDCGIYPCFFSAKDLSYFKSIFPNFKFGCGNQPAFDVFPNGKSIYCFPLENSINNFLFPKDNPGYNLKFFIFIDFNKTEEDLKKQFIKLKEKLFCEDCFLCEYNISKLCEGICPAFLKE